MGEKGTWGHLLTEAMAVRHKLELVMGSCCSQLMSKHCPPPEATLHGRRKLGKRFFLMIFHLFILCVGFLSKRRTQESRQLKTAVAVL